MCVLMLLAHSFDYCNFVVLLKLGSVSPPNLFFFSIVLFFVFCFLKIYWLIDWLLCWVFVSVLGLSLVAASGGHSSSWCTGLSLSWPLLLRSTCSRRAGSVVVAHGPSCSAACRIFPDQGSNPCPLHWQADSQPLRHQGSPRGSKFFSAHTQLSPSQVTGSIPSQPGLWPWHSWLAVGLTIQSSLVLSYPCN